MALQTIKKFKSGPHQLRFLKALTARVVVKKTI
jgi:hypothetical protein